MNSPQNKYIFFKTQGVHVGFYGGGGAKIQKSGKCHGLPENQ